MPFDGSHEGAASASNDGCLELERQLEQAVHREDFQEAARLRDVLQERSLNGELSVLCANREFFQALKTRDIERMSDMWHKGDHSCCIHQAQRPVHGHQPVMESWELIFRNARQKHVGCELQSVVIRDNIGRVVVTNEKANSVITNFFELTPEGWKLWCHQAGTITHVKPSTALGALVRAVPKLCVSAVKAVLQRFLPGRPKQQPQLEPQRKLHRVFR